MIEIQNYIGELITGITTLVLTWLLAKRKNNADTRLVEIEAEVKTAEFYKSLLVDAKVRLDEAIDTINKQNETINKQNEIIDKQNKQLKVLIPQVEHLTEELKKYKQLNGKS